MLLKSKRAFKPFEFYKRYKTISCLGHMLYLINDPCSYLPLNTFVALVSIMPWSIQVLNPKFHQTHDRNHLLGNMPTQTLLPSSYSVYPSANLPFPTYPSCNPHRTAGYLFQSSEGREEKKEIFFPRRDLAEEHHVWVATLGGNVFDMVHLAKGMSKCILMLRSSYDVLQKEIWVCGSDWK